MVKCLKNFPLIWKQDKHSVSTSSILYFTRLPSQCSKARKDKLYKDFKEKNDNVSIIHRLYAYIIRIQNNLLKVYKFDEYKLIFKIYCYIWAVSN